MLNSSSARVRDAKAGVATRPRESPSTTWTTPPSGALHSGLTPRDREMIQDWMARRYLQLHEKRFGRRRTDSPMPDSVRSTSRAERFAKYTTKTNERWKV